MKKRRSPYEKSYRLAYLLACLGPAIAVVSSITGHQGYGYVLAVFVTFLTSAAIVVGGILLALHRGQDEKRYFILPIIGVIVPTPLLFIVLFLSAN